MKRFDDLLPEEREPQHEELITLLQRAYRRPAPVPPTEKEEIITQVRERLVRTDHGDSLNGDIPIPQIGVLDSSPHQAVSPPGKSHGDRRRFRLMALLAAAMIIVVLLGTPLILLRPWLTGGAGGLPTLTLSSNAAKVGATVTLHLEHFTPAKSVALTHDIQEPIPIKGSASIMTDANGSATFAVVIDTDWGPGFHLIVAEDVTTRNTASATLQITGEGPTPPTHLLIDTTPIELGADVVGANTIRPFTLANSGGGSISWAASSNKPWLLVSPSQGIFSQQQTLSLTAQRVGLQPGDYSGSISISTNVSPPQRIQIDMTVRPLPANAGPVIALAPALLSFTATDGGSDPVAQSLTISNPGSRSLNWSLALEQGSTCNWLSATPNSGTVAPGTTRALHIIVQNQCLLPGEYLATLKFTATGALNGAQVVNVSLTVQPRCGLVSSTGYLAFTVVQGQNSPANQTLNLNTTASCAEMPISWTTSSVPSWLTISPASGQLRGPASTVVSVSVNAAGLTPKVYSSTFSFVTGQSTLTVMVKLTVQAAPPLVAPIMGVSPLNLNFSYTQLQPNPTGQVVTITNNGGSTLKWHTLVPPAANLWLGAAPSGGTIAPRQTGQVTITVSTANLTSGNYVGQITLDGFDEKGNLAPGSPQTITISLVVQPPCTISAPSSSALSFSAVQAASANPAAQTIMFPAWGSCVWPVTWTTNVAPTARWLSLTPAGGTVRGTGQSGSLSVAASIAGLPAGTYTTQVTISASDASGAAVQGSPETFAVTLTVQPPCVLASPSPASLAFTVPQGQPAPPTQNVTFSETGTCARPVTWTASARSAWLVPAPAGTDSGSGSTLGVTVTAASLTPGTYAGTITITATDSTGAAVLGSGQVHVTLTVTGFPVSGNVVACPGSTPPTCASPQPLPGATVTLTSGSTTVATTTADAAGNYAFSNVPLGTYTISVAGSDAGGNHYVGTATLTVTGNTSNFTLQAFPGQ